MINIKIVSGLMEVPSINDGENKVNNNKMDSILIFKSVRIMFKVFHEIFVVHTGRKIFIRIQINISFK